MAPTGNTAEAVSQRAVVDARKDKDCGEEIHSDALPRMTPELLQTICKERQMWMQPHLNTQLYLNYKGFLRMEGMEDYVNVRSLMLDNNNISRIEGLDRMTELRTLYLGGNRIGEISGLESNVDLRHLNLEGNAIRQVANVRHLVNLEHLNLSCNRVENIEDLADLKELPKLINMDVSQNQIESGEGVVEFWTEFQNLKVLRYHGNPGIRHVAHYRKRIINGLQQLTYMDERPVFPVERKSCQAWETGGLEAMHEAKKEFHRIRHAQAGVDADRKELVTKMRNMAIERINREAKEREEKQEAEQREADMKKGALGAGLEAQDGDIDALKAYEKSWQQKVGLYGADQVRSKVAQEMGGQPKALASAQAPTQREHAADFDFAPPSRSAASQDPGTQAAPAAGRRQERAPVDVAGFCQRSTGEARDHTDRVFSVLSDDVEVSLGSSSAAAPNAAKGAGGQAAADGHVMPLIWENRQAETKAAEAECMEMNARASRSWGEDTGPASSGPAAFRSNQMDTLD